jgi:DNA-binding transcriptional ArsR family regulator
LATDDEIQNALLAIHSRLATIEGKINLVARAERDAILTALQAAIAKDPLLGQIYLLIDGRRTQQEILAELAAFGINSSQPTVSRRMTDLLTEYGIVDEVRGGNSLVLRKNRAAEDILNLGRRVRRWLDEGHHVIPERTTKRPRKRAT